MKLFIFSFLLIIICFSCKKVTEPINPMGWDLQFDNNDDITYYGIQFADELNGWIVGYSGTIKNTTDGGSSWEEQLCYIESDLWDLCFISNETGWICGADNTLLKTTNAGKTWNKITLSGNPDIINVEIKFIDEMIGWMSNNHGEILKSTDGGMSWELVRANNLGGSRLAVFDENTAYFLNRKLFRTFDGGLTWDSLLVSTPKNYMKNQLFFPDPNNGYITTGNGTGGQIITEFPVLISKDAGLSWQISDSLFDGESPGLWALYFIDKDNGWVAGSKRVYKTINGGISWTLDFESTHIGAKGMFFLDKNNGWIISWFGKVYRYSDS